MLKKKYSIRGKNGQLQMKNVKKDIKIVFEYEL